ncbi:hypothetical protein H1R20_g13171, partial [Candolleomyces eurysporus]
MFARYPSKSNNDEHRGSDIVVVAAASVHNLKTAAGLVLEKEFEGLRNTLNGRMNNIQKTFGYLQSATHIGKADREKKNEVPRLSGRSFRVSSPFSRQGQAPGSAERGQVCFDGEDSQSEDHGKGEVQRQYPRTSCLEEVAKDRDSVKASLATKTAEPENTKERASLNASGLRTQLEEVKKERDFTKAAQLDAQTELELKRKALQESEEESEVLRQGLE